MNDRKIKVLYIGGYGRSGSTLLGNILGQLDGFLHVGEVVFLWEVGILRNRSCGCGAPVNECTMWKAVCDQALGPDKLAVSQEMIQLRDSALRLRNIARLKLGWGIAQHVNHSLKKYFCNIATLYRTLRDLTQCRVIIDSSKRPSYIYALASCPSLELYVVHLVRDPRAVAYSWQRRKLRTDAPTPFYQETRSPYIVALMWSAWNMIIPALSRQDEGRYMRLKYEDFIRKPKDSVERILTMLGEEPSNLPFTDDHTVQLAPTHTCGGNPSRMTTGGVEIRMDDEWKAKMRLRDKIIVTALSWPLRLLHGEGACRLARVVKGVYQRTPPDPREFILEAMPKGSVCGEVGVWKGDFSHRILAKVRPVALHLIDPWRYEPGDTYRDAWYGGKAASQAQMDSVYQGVMVRFKKWIAAGRVVIHRASSAEAASRFPDGYFDWVYIDGNHLYDFVKQDLEAYLPKVKKGGYITGDDYRVGGWWRSGVKRAVDEFVSKGECETFLIRDCQFILRKA